MPVTLSASSAMMTVDAGEHDGGAGRAGREADRLAHAVAFLELPAVAVDDEQRVVDADREAEHDAEHRGDRHHVDDARERQRGDDADADADERGDDREPGADERAEHDDEHDGREDEADRLADAEELGDARGDLRGEVDRDAVDGLGAERVLRRPCLVAGGTSNWVSLNMTGATAALPSSDTSRIPDDMSSRAAPTSSLAALRVELRLAGVELGLLGGETGRGLVERAGRLGLRPRGVELRLALLELGGRLRRSAPGRRRSAAPGRHGPPASRTGRRPGRRRRCPTPRRSGR